MAGGSGKANPPKPRKRVEAESGNGNALLRAKDGSAFARCEECSKNVPVALISMHSCSLDAKIRMNLEAQVVEKPAEAKKKSVERKKPAASDEPKPKRLRKLKDKEEKKGNGSAKPKRPPTAFFLFMDDFRKSCKEENPGSSAAKEVAKLGGEKWKSMTDEEKKPYLDKAAELKAEYAKSLESNIAESEQDGNLDKESDEKDGSSEKEAEDKEADKEKEEEEVLDDY